MKHLIISTLAVLLMGLPLSVSAQKLAFVDMQYILDNMPEYEEAQAELNRFSAKWQKEIEDRHEQIRKLKDAYNAEAILLTPEMKKTRQDAIKQKEKEALGAIKEQLQLVLNGIGEQELERAKNYIVGSFEIGLQRNSAQAFMVGFDELYGIGTYEYRKFPEKILAVTVDDVARVARKYINPEAAAVAILKPE